MKILILLILILSTHAMAITNLQTNKSVSKTVNKSTLITNNLNLLKKANPNQLGLTSIAWHFGGGSDACFTACATERNICMATGGSQCFLEYFACTDNCIIVWN